MNITENQSFFVKVKKNPKLMNLPKLKHLFTREFLAKSAASDMYEFEDMYEYMVQELVRETDVLVSKDHDGEYEMITVRTDSDKVHDILHRMVFGERVMKAMEKGMHETIFNGMPEENKQKYFADVQASADKVMHAMGEDKPFADEVAVEPAQTCNHDSGFEPTAAKSDNVLSPDFVPTVQTVSMTVKDEAKPEDKVASVQINRSQNNQQYQKNNRKNK